jgi:hypothetical protein
MADPVLTDIYKCQVVFQGNSNLPEDQFVNNWYFRNDEIGVGPQLAIKAVLDAFYTGSTPNGQTVANMISPHVNRAFTYKVYNLGLPPPRPPTILAANPLPPQTGAGLPGEVAIVSSFYAGTNTKRKRGRHYIGPLGTVTSDAGASPRPSSGTMASIANRAQNVAQTTENVTWVQVSQVASLASVVTNGWVDNAYDTQRRRGNAPSTRTNWVG